MVRGGKVHQIHDTVVWQDGDYYLALYQYQHNGEKLDVELAASRDGENFVFVKPGTKVIPVGQPGDWDCSHVTPSPPILDKDEIKLYYGGICGDESRAKGAAGLATLRLDGYTDLELAESRRDGSLTTIPISRGNASQLYVNGNSGSQGYLEVELIDAASGRAIPGFSRADAIRVVGDATAQPVRWKNESDLSRMKTKAFQIRIYFEGVNGFPKLYSLGFK